MVVPSLRLCQAGCVVGTSYPQKYMQMHRVLLRGRLPGGIFSLLLIWLVFTPEMAARGRPVTLFDDHSSNTQAVAIGTLLFVHQ